jgi:hypothetical protein
MRHHRQQSVRFRKSRLVAVGAVAVLTLAACGSASGTPKTVPGQSPPPTTTSNGGYGY